MDGCVKKSKRQGEKIGKRNEGRKEKFFMFMRVIDEHPCSNFTYANVKPQRNCACILLSDISREIEKSSIFEQLKISFFFFLFFDIITLPTPFNKIRMQFYMELQNIFLRSRFIRKKCLRREDHLNQISKMKILFFSQNSTLYIFNILILRYIFPYNNMQFKNLLEFCFFCSSSFNSKTIHTTQSLHLNLISTKKRNY